MSDIRTFDDYIDRVQHAVQDKYGFRFSKKAIAIILKYVLKNIITGLYNNQELYVKGKISIYFDKNGIRKLKRSRF